MWADWDGPKELSRPANRAQRCGVTNAPARIGRRASPLRLSEIGGEDTAGEECRRRGAVAETHWRMHRIYREEGLAMRRKEANRLRAIARTVLEQPARPLLSNCWGGAAASVSEGLPCVREKQLGHNPSPAIGRVSVERNCNFRSSWRCRSVQAWPLGFPLRVPLLLYNRRSPRCQSREA